MDSNDHKGRINQGCHWGLSVRKMVQHGRMQSSLSELRD